MQLPMAKLVRCETTLADPTLMGYLSLQTIEFPWIRVKDSQSLAVLRLVTGGPLVHQWCWSVDKLEVEGRRSCCRSHASTRFGKDMDQECDSLLVDGEVELVAVNHDGVVCKNSAAIRMVSQHKPRPRRAARTIFEVIRLDQRQINTAGSYPETMLDTRLRQSTDRIAAQWTEGSRA